MVSEPLGRAMTPLAPLDQALCYCWGQFMSPILGRKLALLPALLGAWVCVQRFLMDLCQFKPLLLPNRNKIHKGTVSDQAASNGYHSSQSILVVSEHGRVCRGFWWLDCAVAW